jgi:hypothetical protein
LSQGISLGAEPGTLATALPVMVLPSLASEWLKVVPRHANAFSKRCQAELSPSVAKLMLRHHATNPAAFPNPATDLIVRYYCTSASDSSIRRTSKRPVLGRGLGTTGYGLGFAIGRITARAGEQVLEETMRIWLFTLVIVVGIESLGTAVKAQNFPWCAHYAVGGDGMNCGFVSLPQCLANVRGIGGICMRNTQFAPYAPPFGPGPIP